MSVRRRRSAAAARRTAQKADLHEIRLVNVLNRDGLLADRRGQRFQPDGSAVVKLDQRVQQAPVVRVQSDLVDLQAVERQLRGFGGDVPPRNDLGEIPDAFQQPVRNPRRAAGTRRDFERAVRLDGNSENLSAPRYDARQLARCVKLQPQHHAEAVAQRRAELAGPRGGADQGEFRKGQMVRSRHLPFPGDNIEGEVLHGGVKDFFHAAGKAVDFIDEKHVTRAEVRQDRREVARLFDRGPGRDAEIYAEFVRYDARQRRLAKAGRTVQQHVVEAFFPLLRRFDENGKILLHLILTDIFRKGARTERIFDRTVLRGILRRHDAVFIIAVVRLRAHAFPTVVFCHRAAATPFSDKLFPAAAAGIHRLQRKTDQFLHRKAAVELRHDFRRVGRRIAKYGKGVHGRVGMGGDGNLPHRQGAFPAGPIQILHLVAQLKRDALGKLRPHAARTRQGFAVPRRNGNGKLLRLQFGQNGKRRFRPHAADACQHFKTVPLGNGCKSE